MRGELLGLLAACSGCHTVLGLERNPIDASLEDVADADLDAAPGCWTSLRQDHDEDGDGRMDGCDNCPATPNANQLDDDSDGVGNVCDPRTGMQHRIAMFRSFHVEADRIGFMEQGAGQWATLQDALVLNVPATASLISTARFQGAIVTTRFAPPTMAATPTEVGIYASYDGAERLSCLVHREAAAVSVSFERYVLNMMSTVTDPQSAIGTSVGMQLFVSSPQSATPRCDLDTVDDASLMLVNPGPLEGSVGIFAENSGMALEYLLVIEPR